MKTELVPQFGDPKAIATPWLDCVRLLEEAPVYWLATVHPGGQPNVTPLYGVWHKDAFYFCTGPSERKFLNLAENSACTLTTGTNRVEGLDVVVEGKAERIQDHPLLEELAVLWPPKYGQEWTWKVENGNFQGSQNHAAPVFRIKPSKAFSFGKGEVFSQTRYLF